MFIGGTFRKSAVYGNIQSFYGNIEYGQISGDINQSTATSPMGGSGDTDEQWIKYLKWLEKKKRKQVKSAGNRDGLSEHTAIEVVKKAIEDIKSKEIDLRKIYEPIIDPFTAKEAAQKAVLMEYNKIWDKMVRQELQARNLEYLDDEDAIMVLM